MCENLEPMKYDFSVNRILYLFHMACCSLCCILQGLFLCTWRLFNKSTSGIYVEIEFL